MSPRRRQPVERSAVELAGEIAETVRDLNHATHPADRFPSLIYPANAYEVLAALSTATDRLGQTIGQLARYLRTQYHRPGLVDFSTTHRGRPDLAIDDALGALNDALGPLALASRLLNQAQQATSGLAINDNDPDDETGEAGR